MVSLDNFILFDTPYSSCDNFDYISSSTVRVFSSYYLLGCNRLYSKQGGYWVLKAILVEDKLITDYSFEDIKILDEQILILSAFDRVVTVQWETLWDYFKLPSMAELNEISRKLTDRKIECYNNPLKTIYYKVLDEGKTTLSFEEWEVEMNTLFIKWKDCERVRLIDRCNSESWTEDFLNERAFNNFITRYYNNDITFYQKEVISEVQSEYEHAVNEIRLSTGLGERDQLRQVELPLSEYVDRMRSLYHTRLTSEGVARYATIVHNYHNPIIEEVSSEESQYQDSLNFFTQSTGLLESGILPEDDEILETYINSLSELDYDDTGITVGDITHHATIVYNHHRSTHSLLESVLDEIDNHPY